MNRKAIRRKVAQWCELFDEYLDAPVKVVFSAKLQLPEMGDTARVSWSNPQRRHYVIRIHPCCIGHPLTLLLVKHEFAHVMSWATLGRHDHSPEWGISEARLWSYETESEPSF